MKKIVALVLSLVMVLGLAVSAYAVPTTAATDVTTAVGNYYYQYTDGSAVYGTAQAVTYHAAKAPVYNNVTGDVDVKGQVAYYTIGMGTAKYVEVASLGLADIVLYNDVDNGVGVGLFKYLDLVKTDVDYYGNGVAFTDFGVACGQYKDANYDATATYYTFEGDVYKATVGGSARLMVGGNLVDVEPASGAWVGHTAAYTYDKNFKVTAVTCSKCGCAAVIVPNYASLPVAAIADGIVGGPINTSEYYYWTETVAAPEAPETDKVESAETFDAGIAMYVGMSVMAAAGSAVVLKKKD